jgi:YegS/Rv2252/BmrU family lipid kinase
MRTVVFINTHSRQAAQNIDDLRKFFSKSTDSFDVLDFIIVEDLEKFDTYLERLSSHKEAECVIVGSGDGTIVAVINTLKKRKGLVYGFVPLGTSNTFVRSLGLPIDIRKALRALLKNHVREVSLGSINGTLFANIADIGVPAQVVENLTDRVKKYLGSFAYAISGMRELIRHDAIKCEVEANGQTKSFYTHQLFIANGKYRGPVPVSNDTSAYSDKLTLGYSATPSRWEYFKDAFGFLIRTAPRHRNLYFITIEKATVRTRPVRSIQADGEIISKTPANVKVVKNAIRVLTLPEQKNLRRKLRKSRR